MMTYPSSTEPDLLMEARMRQIPKNYVAYPDQEFKECPVCGHYDLKERFISNIDGSWECPSCNAVFWKEPIVQTVDEGWYREI